MARTPDKTTPGHAADDGIAADGPPSRRRWPWLLRLVFLAGLLALMVPQVWYLAQVWQYVEDNPQTTAFMEMRLAGLREDHPDAQLNHQWVAYDDISPWLIRAVIIAEDARFMDHRGFDWEALGEARDRNLEQGGIVRGGSTLTQQLAKNLFLSERRDYARKAQEALIAAMIEQSMDKRRILELYLNVIEWGDGVFGVEAAARHYFGTSAAHLGPWHSSLLAARIPRPRFYDQRGHTPYLLQRAAQINDWIELARIP